MEACVRKWEKYFEKIKDMLLENMVYIDKTDIEIATVKNRGRDLKSNPYLPRRVVSIMREQISYQDLSLTRQ